MEAVIVGTSAFELWRTPPIVKLLAAGPDDHPALEKLVSEQRLVSVRNRLLTDLPLNKISLEKTACWKNVGHISRQIREAHPVLAPSLDGPINVLACRKPLSHATEVMKPWLWTAELPFGATVPISGDLRITTPEMTLHMLAARVSLMTIVLLASELCGSFSVYNPPAPVTSLLERLHREGQNLCVDGWSPGFDGRGKLTGLWQRAPLTDPGELVALAEKSEAKRGKAKLIEAAGLVNPNAASPFEVQAGLLLGLSRKRGGEGYQGLEHNKRILLSRDAKLLAQRENCYCDIYFSEGVDVECQSRAHHSGEGSYLSDSDRSAALDAMGIVVVQATYQQFFDWDRFNALSRVIAGHLGVVYKQKSESLRVAARGLRREIFVPWEGLPIV